MVQRKKEKELNQNDGYISIQAGAQLVNNFYVPMLLLYMLQIERKKTAQAKE